jgi:antitoxin VapB
MAFSIRNQKVEEKARAYAAQHGTTLTGALEMALDKAISQEEIDREAAYEEWAAPIRALQDRVAASPDTGLTEDEIMGWDENGLPT